jgi:MerR family transcriptional regulator/heat shock protein HspR
MRSALTVRLSQAGQAAIADGADVVSIGPVAARLKVTEQTLRLYESHGLVKPARRGRERAYRPGDIQWLACLRRLIHGEKVSIEGVKRLLRFAPCWEITGRRACPRCPVFRDGVGGPALPADGRRRVRVA